MIIRIVTNTVLLTIALTAYAWANLGESTWGFRYFTFKEYADSLVKTDAGMVVDGIRLLPKELKENFTIVHSGHARQQSSEEFPRFLHFGETGHLIVTFNGHRAQFGYDALETVEFDEASKRIFFRAIVFKNEPAVNKTMVLQEDIEFQTDKMIVSKPNPVMCMECHVNDRTKFDDEMKRPHRERLARYIWGDYTGWPSAHGAIDDQILNRDYVNSKKIWARQERYALILDTPEKITGAFPYYGVTASDRILANRPNARATMLMSLHYANQMASLAKQTKFSLVRDSSDDRRAKLLSSGLFEMNIATLDDLDSPDFREENGYSKDYHYNTGAGEHGSLLELIDRILTMSETEKQILVRKSCVPVHEGPLPLNFSKLYNVWSGCAYEK